ncbi:MAG: hypothetical protein AB7V45_06230 [Candidatus Krumholzibacteriia bacterium]
MIRILALALLLAVGAAAWAAPVRIDNPAQPSGGVTSATVTERWRAGGEDDEVFFGNVGAIKLDKEGNILLLDSQLSEVHVFSPEGDLLRTICGEGDGPGEARRPGDMLVAADGTVCVLQGFPGRIVMLHPDGTPAGEARYTTGQEGEGQFAVLSRGLALPDGLLLAGISMDFGGGALSNQNYFLADCDQTGLRRHLLLGKVYTINYADFELAEGGMDFVWSRIAAGPDGTVYFAPDRDLYEIQVSKGGGEPVRVITRPFTNVPRTEAQKTIARQILEGVGAYYPTPPRRTPIEDTNQVVAGMWATADGNLWVQTSEGITPPPEGCWVALDLFDAAGNWIRQVGLPGDFDADKDGLAILRDGTVVVTVGALDAFLSQQAVGSEESAAAADPLEVIVYGISF